MSETLPSAGSTVASRVLVTAGDLEGPRTLRPEELAAAHRLSATCFGRSVLRDLPTGAYRPTSRQTTEVICYRGTPVSLISIYYSRVNVYGSLVRIASIGGVGTHPDYRGMGLATRLLEHCMHELTAREARIMLVSGMRGLYRRAGCTAAQIFDPIVLNPGSLRPDTTGVTIRRGSVVDAPLCARLYHGESIRFERRVEDFRQHLATEEGPSRGDSWVVEVEGRPTGYVFLSVPWGREREDRVREVLIQGEYAGSRVALVEALAQLIEHLDLRELWLAVAWQDSDLRQMLRKSGVAGETSTMVGHTMRIVDFPGLMDDLDCYVRARLSAEQLSGVSFQQDGDRYAIAYGPDRIELDGAAMTRLVLGPAGAVEGVGQPLVQSLGEIACQLFPLPSFTPGLNCR